MVAQPWPGCLTRSIHGGQPTLAANSKPLSEVRLRYFPVSQDINADPEVWELTDKFGDRSLRVWLEILSIADRNNGYLPGPWIDYPSILAGRCKSTARHLRAVCEWVTRWLDVDSQGVARVRNFSKYHKTRAENRPPPNQTKPNLTIEDKNKREAPKPIELPDWLHAGAWESFIEHRKRIKKPLGPRAASLAINELGKLRNAGHDPDKVIDQSVLNGWAGLFPIKPQLASVNGRSETPADRLSARIQRLTGGTGL